MFKFHITQIFKFSTLNLDKFIQMVNFKLFFYDYGANPYSFMYNQLNCLQEGLEIIT
jgi:hypothetical protein